MLPFVVAVGIKPTQFSSGIDEVVEEEVVILGPDTNLVVVVGKEDDPTQLTDRRSVSEMTVGSCLCKWIRFMSKECESNESRRPNGTDEGVARTP